MDLGFRRVEEAGDSAAPDRDAFAMELPDHARTAVEATALLMNLAHLLDEVRISERAITYLPTLPRVVTSARDLVEHAHHLDRVALPVCRDEGEDVRLGLNAMP